MWRATLLVAGGIAMAATGRLAAQDQGGSTASSATAQQSAPRAAVGAPSGGVAKNRWRYRFANGRWWYWTAENRWSYFDGARWRPYTATAAQATGSVDPARLRLERKEGALGWRRWPRSGLGGVWNGRDDAGGLPLSGTQGSVGGWPSGSFTNPMGVPSAMNSSIGTTTDADGLNARGRAFSGFGVGGSMGRVGRPR